MFVRSRRTSLLAVLVSATAFVVAACGGSDSGSDTGGDAKPTKQQEASATKQIDINEQPLDKVKQGGTIRWAVDQLSTQWNYNQINGPNSATAQVLYGVMPYVFIADKTATTSPNPDYLTSAKADNSSGKQVVTMEINPKAKWSDGTPITEKDFETQWDALKDPTSKYQIASSTGYDRIESVKQGKDEHEVIATFSKPFADWKSLWSPMYPAKYQDTADHFNKGYFNKIPVTAGPFKVDKIDKSAKTVTMTADPNWWGAKPKLDRIITRSLEGDAGVNAFVNGEVDVNLLPNDPASYKRAKSAKNGVIRVAGGPDFRHFTFNGTSPNLSDVNVRQAIAMSINRNAINKADLTGLPWPARTMDNHFLVNTQAGYKANAGTVGQYDPEKAKQMLDAAGWKMGSGGFRTKGGKTLDLRFVIPVGIAGEQAGRRADPGDAEGCRRQDRRPRRAERGLLRQVRHPGQLRHHAVLVARDAVPDLVGAVDLRQPDEGLLGRAADPAELRPRRLQGDRRPDEQGGGDARPERGVRPHQPGGRRNLERGPLGGLLPAAADERRQQEPRERRLVRLRAARLHEDRVHERAELRRVTD